MSILDGVTLPTTLGMSQGCFSCTRLVLGTFLGQHHVTIAKLESSIRTLLDRYQELEDYHLRKIYMRPQVPAVLICWV